MGRSGAKINWTDEFTTAYLEHLVRCKGVVMHSVRPFGIRAWSVYHHAKEDPEFARQFEIAKRVGAEQFEDVCYRDALYGVKEPVFSGGVQAKDCHGNPAYIVRIPWGPRLAFLARFFPDAYGKQRHELSGPGGGPISTNATVHVYIPDNGRKPQGDAVEPKPDTGTAGKPDA